MKYQYLTVLNSDPNGKHFRRPVVDVEIFGSNRTINTFALLDSGADNCLFHLEYAKEIGIDLEKDEKSSSGTLLVQLKEYERETEQKLSELVNLYPDGDIPKENYLAKKNELLKEKVSLNEKLKSARAERKNWVEPLREWILDIKKATQLTSSDNFFEIKDYFKKIGTNSVLREKSVSISFCPPTEFACARKAAAGSVCA